MTGLFSDIRTGAAYAFLFALGVELIFYVFRYVRHLSDALSLAVALIATGVLLTAHVSLRALVARSQVRTTFLQRCDGTFEEIELQHDPKSGRWRPIPVAYAEVPESARHTATVRWFLRKR